MDIIYEMKKTGLLILLIVIVQFVFARTQSSLPETKAKKFKNDLEKEHLSGKINTVAEYTYGASDSAGVVIKDGLIDTKIFKYDEKGKKSEEKGYSISNGFVNVKYIYDNGIMIEQDRYCDTIGNLCYKNIFKYDNKGNKIEEFGYNNSRGNINEKYIYKYDEKGLMIEQEDYSPSDLSHFSFKTIFKYDDKGNRIEDDIYSEAKDMAGNRIKNDTYGIIVGKNIYKYDSKANKVEENGYDGNAYIMVFAKKHAFRYDDKGNLTEDKLFENDSLSSTITTTFKFENIDTENNWLREIIFSNGKPTTIVERMIEYAKEK